MISTVNNFDVVPIFISSDTLFAHKSLRVFFCSELKSAEMLFPSEKKLIENCSLKRQIEFCKGRYCAHQALEKLGQSGFAILRDPNGAPIWPSGITGSISHSGDIAAAVVAKETEILAIGLDLQITNQTLPFKVLTTFFHSDEIQNFLNVPDSLSELFSYVVFSAKESILKCYYTINRSFLDLHEISVKLDWWHGTFKTRITGEHGSNAHMFCDQLTGRFSFAGDYVFSAAWLSR